MNFTLKRCLPAFFFFPLACCVLRYLQRSTELLADGSLAEGAFLHRVLPLVSVCFAVGVVILFWKLERHTSHASLFCSRPLMIALIAASAVLLLGNVLLWIGGSDSTGQYAATSPALSEFLTKLLPPLGIAAAVCIVVYACRCLCGAPPSALLYMCASLYLVVRLIVRFQAWNTDPSIHDYCYALLAAICTMLAAFHFAGFCLNCGKRRMTLFWQVCSVHFCCIALADAVCAGDLSELLIIASLLLINAFNAVQLLLAPDAPTKEDVGEDVGDPTESV